MDEIEVAGEVGASLMQWCAVYDIRTGAVVHLHEHIGLEGARRRSKDLALDAMAEVSPQHDRRHLYVAHPKRGVALERGVRYRLGIDDRHVRAERRERPKPRHANH